MFYMTAERTYETVGEFLAFETSGLAEYVTAEEMQALKDGSLPIGDIADRYMLDLDHARLRTEDAETRSDLLSWISYEIDASREMDRWIAADEAMLARLAEIRAFAEKKKAVEARMQGRLVEMLAEAYASGPSKPSKGALADAALISRPTLDAWFRDAAEAAPTAPTSAVS